MKNVYYHNDELFQEYDVRVYKRQAGDANWPSVPHSHEYMQLYYVVQGECYHLVENGSYHMREGCVLMVPPNVEHCVQNPSSDCIVYACEFPVEILLWRKNNNNRATKEKKIFKCAYVESLEAVIRKTRPCYIPSKACQASIVYSFEKIFNALEKRLDFYELEIKAETFLLLVNIYRDYNKVQTSVGESYQEDIKKAVQYINEHFRERLYIKTVANEASMSESYFFYFFKEIMGCTFTSYVNSIRIKTAKELLETTDETVVTIATNVGCDNVTYFNKVFKAQTGVSPSEYRKLRVKK